MSKIDQELKGMVFERRNGSKVHVYCINFKYSTTSTILAKHTTLFMAKY